MKNLIVSFIAWVIRPALRKLMEERYGRSEMSESMKKWIEKRSVEVSPEYFQQFERQYEELNDRVHRQERPSA